MIDDPDRAGMRRLMFRRESHALKRKIEQFIRSWGRKAFQELLHDIGAHAAPPKEPPR
jgi:hypothetical protein